MRRFTTEVVMTRYMVILWDAIHTYSHREMSYSCRQSSELYQYVYMYVCRVHAVGLIPLYMTLAMVYDLLKCYFHRTSGDRTVPATCIS